MILPAIFVPYLVRGMALVAFVGLVIVVFIVLGEWAARPPDD